MSYSNDTVKETLLTESITDSITHGTLLNGSPVSTNDFTNEIGHRFSITWDIVDGVATNSNEILLEVSSDVTVTHIGLATSANVGSGAINFSIPLNRVLNIMSGQKFELPAGNIKASFFDEGPILGFNDEPNKSGTFGNKFLNSFKAGYDVSGTSRTLQDNRNIIRDSDGWPASLLQGQVIRWHVPSGPSGRYVLDWSGTGTLQVENVSNVSMINSNRLEFDAGRQEDIVVKWTTIGPVNARCYPLAFEANINNGEVFYPDFINELSQSSVIRFSEALPVRNLPFTFNLSSRPLPTDATEATNGFNYGLSLESICQICNEANSDLWLCFPPMIDDGNLTKFQPRTFKRPLTWTENKAKELIQIIKDNLNDSLKVYLEHGDQVMSDDLERLNHKNLLKNKGTQINVPVYNEKGTLNSNGTAEAKAFSYHAWRTAQLGNHLRNVLGKRLVNVLSLESGKEKNNLRIFNFLSSQSLLQNIDAISFNTVVGKNSYEGFSASYLMDNFNETLVLEVNSNNGHVDDNVVNIQFTSANPRLSFSRKFYNNGDWTTGSDNLIAKTLAEGISKLKSNWSGFSIENKVYVNTQGFSPLIISSPSSITQQTSLTEDVVLNILSYNLQYDFTEEMKINRNTISLFKKPAYASNLGIYDIGGDETLESLRQSLILNSQRNAIGNALISRWRDYVKGSFMYGDRPLVVCLNSLRHGGDNFEDPKSLQQIIIDYDEDISTHPDIFHDSIASTIGRDEILNTELVTSSVFNGTAQVSVTHLGLLTRNKSQISNVPLVSVPNGTFSTVVQGKRLNSNEIIFNPTAGDISQAHYLGFFDGNTLIGHSILNVPMRVEENVSLTLPVNSIIVSG